jgi:hypothetical protein
MPDSPEEKKAEYHARKNNGLCIQCGVEKATNGVLCEKHGQERTLTNRARRANFIKYRDCIDCGYKLDDNRLTRCSECLLVNSVSAFRSRNKMKPELLERARDFRKKVKDEVFNAYGGWVCACCGETIRDFLSLDHINGGGNNDRKVNRLGHGHTFYALLRKNNFPPGYQVLCMNCNFGKRYSMVCPHKAQEKTNVAAA